MTFTREKDFERVIEITNRITKENLSEYYARYNRFLMIESDGDNDEEREFLILITDVLKDMIVTHYMKEQGYYYETRDTYPCWEKE